MKPGGHLVHLRTHVVRPVLYALGMHSPAAEDLMMGTAVQESGGRYMVQLGGGPALGLWQMEPATHDDLCDRYLRRREDLAVRSFGFLAPMPKRAEQMAGNAYYACAMARIRYWMVDEKLPAHGDVQGYAGYWKRHYNTALGAGTEAEFVEKYRRYLTEG